jgi:hypothetical protein
LFISFPEANIIAADQTVRSIPWVESGTGILDAVLEDSWSSDSSSSSSDNGDSGGEGGVACKSNKCHKEASHKKNESTPRAIFGTNLSSWIPAKLYTLIIEGIEEMVKDKSCRSFHFFENNSSSYAMSLSLTKEGFFLRLASKLKKSTTLLVIFTRPYSLSVASWSATQTKKLSMLPAIQLTNSFNDDCSGEIIHEIKNETVTLSFLGMRFPAGDIPLPA